MVERDGVAFTEDALPDRVLNRLASNRVIVLGETHHLRGHWSLVASLLRDLHARGFRQLLLEAPHMADWIFDDYLTGGALEPTFISAPAFWRRRLDAIRAFNDTLPTRERERVRGIDVNEQHHGGSTAFVDSLRTLMRHPPTSGPVGAFLDVAYGTPQAETEAIETLRTALRSGRSELTSSWGSERYAQVVEMVDVERASIDIRLLRETDNQPRAARMREDTIKRLADARLGGYEHGTVINIGGHHAQKAHLMGTKQEWLGDYLVHGSPAIDGAVVVVVCTRHRRRRNSSLVPPELPSTSATLHRGTSCSG